ncbi:MAG: hypothetical protein Aurels2KO_58640 [Aureliella sp.]
MTPDVSVVGTAAKIASPVANSGVLKGILTKAKPKHGVMMRMVMAPYRNPTSAFRAAMMSVVLSVSPEMMKIVHTFMV